MAGTRLTRTSVTWALGYINAFANPAAPTTAELNNTNLVHLFSCALTEDNTSLTLDASDTDSTITFCSIGNEETRTNQNPKAQWEFLVDANTGGSGSTSDLTSLFNKAQAFLTFPDVPFWVILRTGKQGSRDSAFAVNDRIKMASFNTDWATENIANGKPDSRTQAFLYSGSGVNWNYKLLT